MFVEQSHLHGAEADSVADRSDHAGHAVSAPAICLHVLSPVLTDPRVRRVSAALAEAGFAVTVVDIEEGRQRPRRESIGPVMVKHIRLPGRFSPYYHSDSAFVPWILFKVLRMVLGMWAIVCTPADAYHAVDLVALPGCLIAALVHRKPLIFEAHEMPLADPSITLRPILRAVSTWTCGHIVRRCAAIITVSPPIVDELAEHFGGPRAVLVRSVPQYQPPAQSDRLRTHLGLASTNRIALYQGYLQSDRSLDVLIRAAKYLNPNVVIVLLGNGQSKADLEALAVREGVQNRVRFVPAVPNAELHAWTSSADLGLIVYRLDDMTADNPSNVRMMLPNKLFEFLMAGLPVLSTLPPVEEILATYQVGRVISSVAPEAVAEAINSILADSEALEVMRANALAACERYLRWDVERRHLINLYDTLLRRNSDPALLSAEPVEHPIGAME